MFSLVMGWPLIFHIVWAFLTVALVIWFYGIFNSRSQLLGPVLYQIDTRDMKVALTFDDGPHEDFTPKILDILKEHGVKGTFFVMGERAAENPRLLRRMVDEGHELGNHTYSHNYLLSAPCYTKKKYKAEILAVDNLLASYQIPYTAWVRLPMGFKNGRLLKVARQMGKRVVTFSFRSYDSFGSVEALEQRILRKTYPGAILTLHDGPDKWRNNQSSRTVRALPFILEGLKAKGYSVVTLGELDSGSSAGKL